jgi:uncharacterized membrane protein
MSLMIQLLFILTAISLLLVCGVFWGLYFALSRSYQVFTPSELAKIARTIVANLEVPMRNISMLCLLLIVLSIIFFPVTFSWQWWVLAGALLLVSGSLVITTAIEVPINRQVVTWTDDEVPENWKQLRDRWQYYNVVRTVIAILSFTLFITAVVIGQQ